MMLTIEHTKYTVNSLSKIRIHVRRGDAIMSVTLDRCYLKNLNMN